jgi:hypothetical protein
MANALKCPNPSCPFLFDPTQVPPGAILTCPRCGMRFTLGPAIPPPIAPPPADNFDLTRTLSPQGENNLFGVDAPTATFSEPLPPDPPRPVPSQPLPPSVETASVEASAAAPARPLVRAHHYEENSSWKPVLGVLAVVATAVAIGVFVVDKLNSKTGGTSGTVQFEERNASYRLPVPNWERDDDARSLLGANLMGLRRTGGVAVVAIEARDYNTRNPQPGELKEGITDRLRSLFDDLDSHEEEGAAWAGVPALKTTFRGTATAKLGSGIHVGEAYAIAHKGIGYWFFAIAPESEANQMAADLDDLRGRLKFLAARNEWKETTSASVLMVGDAADYRLTDGDGWWKKLADPRIEDPKADIAFDAEFVSRVKRDIKPRARLAVLVLAPTSDEPMAALREYLREQYDRLYGLKNWQELTDPPLGDSPSSGDRRGLESQRFKVSGSDPNLTKLVVLSAIKLDAQTPDGMKPMVIGAYASCAFEYQQFWEKRLAQLTGTLRPAR